MVGDHNPKPLLSDDPCNREAVLEGCLTVYLPHEIMWNANLMQRGNFINVFLARHVSGTYAHHQEHQIFSTAHTTYAAALKTTTQPKPRCGNRMLQLNIWCSWWWAYVPETCRARNTSIKLPCCIKLAFKIVSWGRCTVKQPSSNLMYITGHTVGLWSVQGIATGTACS